MKSYGEINSEAMKVYGIEHADDKISARESVLNIYEAGAQAVIKEFKRRNNIVIPPEED